MKLTTKSCQSKKNLTIFLKSYRLKEIINRIHQNLASMDSYRQ